MKYLLILLILFSCISPRVFQSEGFFIEQDKVYHYSVYGDTTLVNYRDTRILRNDTLMQFYEGINQNWMTHEKKADKVALACSKLQGVTKRNPEAQEKINRVCARYRVHTEIIKKVLTLT